MDNANKVLAIGVEAGKITAEKILDIIKKFLAQKETGTLITEQTNYKDFNSPGGVSLLNFSPDKKALALLDNMADENDMKYSLKLDSQTNKLYLCLQGTNQEKIVAFMKEYVAKYEAQKAKYKVREQATEKTKEYTKNTSQEVTKEKPLLNKESGLGL